MINYIRQLIDELPDQKIEGQFVMQAQIGAIAEELSRLDPRDFDPSVQAGIVQARANLTHFGKSPALGTIVNSTIAKLRLLLDHYRGEGSGALRPCRGARLPAASTRVQK